MEPRVAFALGFLHGCAEQGLSVAEAEKRAADLASDSPAEKTANWGSTLAMLGLGIPPVAGFYAGSHLAQMTDADAYDVDELRKQETAQMYRETAKRLRLQQLLQRQAQATTLAKPRPLY